jgi:uncharacterized protein (DUF1810 family)
VDDGDPFNLQRFVDAQSGGVYEQALAELSQGLKRSHWMWFIFPQHIDLGRSPTAKYYGLSGLEEAEAYLAHPVLEPRLIECCDALLPHLLNGKPARDVLGDIDALKLRSSMEIFSAAEDHEYRFTELLELARE